MHIIKCTCGPLSDVTSIFAVGRYHAISYLGAIMESDIPPEQTIEHNKGT
jgi:hypothetical protein